MACVSSVRLAPKNLLCTPRPLARGIKPVPWSRLRESAFSTTRKASCAVAARTAKRVSPPRQLQHVQPSASSIAKKRKWPTFVHPESGKRFRVEDQKELENLIRECNAAWVHPIGDLGTSVRFHDMLPDVEYGAVTALPVPKTITICERVHGRVSKYEIPHQEDFEKLQREWNLLGLQGPFPEAWDWSEGCGEGWGESDSTAPLCSHFSDLQDGGSYFMEASGSWRHVTIEESGGYLKSRSRNPIKKVGANGMSGGASCELQSSFVKQICGCEEINGVEVTKQPFGGTLKLEKSKFDGFVITPTEFIVVEAQSTASRQDIETLSSKAAFISANTSWFKRKFDVHIGSRHQLKCALVFENAHDVEGMQAEAGLLFKGYDLCPGIMMLNPQDL